MTTNSGQGGKGQGDQGSELKESITDTYFSAVTESHMARPLLSGVRKLTPHTAVQFRERETLFLYKEGREESHVVYTVNAGVSDYTFCVFSFCFAKYHVG